MNVVIPDGVTAIGKEAFDYCTNLESVIIPEGVESIGDSAFNNCNSLKTITIPEGVTSIGIYAFAYCSGLTSVIIPESVTTMGEGAFSGCEGLADENGFVTVGNVLFNYIGEEGSVTIPDGVTAIDLRAFYYMESLTGVVIPEGVTSIGNSAFDCCHNLESVTIPESVTNIGVQAFAFCGKLADLMIPGSVTKIDDCAFLGCDALNSASFGGNAPESFGEFVFGEYENGFTIHAPKNDETWTSTEAFDGDAQTWNGYSVVFDVDTPDVPDEPVVMPFTDVKEGTWYFDEVAYVYQHGIMVGTDETTFAPNATMTRAMFAQILYNMEGEPEEPMELVFTDINPDAWYAKAINWAYKCGIVAGMSETEFAPEENITREQMAILIYEYAEWKGSDVSASTDLSVLFTDANKIHSWACVEMSWACAKGIINGLGDGTVNPLGYASRAEVASLMHEFMEKFAVETDAAEA